MNALHHYSTAGSANPAWIREMAAMETEPEIAALADGPLSPDPAKDAELRELPV